METLPDVERSNPLGLTLGELQECFADAENDPPTVAWEISVAHAIERMLVRKGQKPDPWTYMLIDQYKHLAWHTYQMSQALAVLLDRCAQCGVEYQDCAEVLENYLSCGGQARA